MQAPALHALEPATLEILVLEERGEVRRRLVVARRALRRQHRAHDVDDQPAERDEVDPDQPVAKVVLPDGGDHERLPRCGSAGWVVRHALHAQRSLGVLTGRVGTDRADRGRCCRCRRRCSCRSSASRRSGRDHAARDPPSSRRPGCTSSRGTGTRTTATSGRTARGNRGARTVGRARRSRAPTCPCRSRACRSSSPRRAPAGRPSGSARRTCGPGPRRTASLRVDGGEDVGELADVHGAAEAAQALQRPEEAEHRGAEAREPEPDRGAAGRG